MTLGISGDGYLKVRHFSQAFHEVERILISARMRHIPLFAGRRITAKGNDVTNPLFPVHFCDVLHFLSGRANTGQMRRTAKTGFLDDTPDDPVRPVTGRSIRAIGHRNESRI
jgi:hypothetical protein